VIRVRTKCAHCLANDCGLVKPYSPSWNSSAGPAVAQRTSIFLVQCAFRRGGTRTEHPPTIMS
jgi:hypothetical protein